MTMAARWLQHRRISPWKPGSGRRVLGRAAMVTAATDPATGAAASRLHQTEASASPPVHEHPTGFWSADGRLQIEAVAINGRAVGVEFRITFDLMSLARSGCALAGVFDRIMLLEWVSGALAGFSMIDLVVDEVRLSSCVSADGSGGVALWLEAGGPGQAAVEGWPLSPAECRTLLEAL